jgi:hypothetical protein
MQVGIAIAVEPDQRRWISYGASDTPESEIVASTYVRARSLVAALTLGAGVGLSAVTAAVSIATAQELEWATRARGTAAFDPDLGLGIATDSPGNSYVTGVFAGTATFGAGTNETELSSSAGTEDTCRSSPMPRTCSSNWSRGATNAAAC